MWVIILTISTFWAVVVGGVAALLGVDNPLNLGIAAFLAVAAAATVIMMIMESIPDEDDHG